MPRLQLCCAKPTVLSDRGSGEVGWVSTTVESDTCGKTPKNGFALENI